MNTLRRIGQTEEEFQHLEKQLEIEEIRAAMVKTNKQTNKQKKPPKQHFLTKALIFDKVHHLF